MKIDLVYCWVDGYDPDWFSKKLYWLNKLHNKNFNQQSITSARWRDNDELKYSLRSVEKFASWINHIFIITDSQIPKWLDISNPKISIVNHTDIIPKKYLPLFNSASIELFIPYIDGLSEYFLYSNDDTFFGRFITQDFFFDKNNNPIIDVYRGWRKYNLFTTQGFEKTKNIDDMWQRQICRMLKMIYDFYGVKYKIRPSHNIEAFRKSYLIDNLSNSKFSKLFEQTKKSKFREEYNLERFLFSLLDNVNNRNTFRINAKPKFKNLILGKKFHTFYTSKANKFEFLKYKPYLFCINDAGDSTDKIRKQNKEFLEKLFPEKSKFEL